MTTYTINLLSFLFPGIMNMTGMIICHMFSTDCALSITGYKYALGNFVFATIKVHEYHVKFSQAILLNNYFH